MTKQKHENILEVVKYKAHIMVTGKHNNQKPGFEII